MFCETCGQTWTVCAINRCLANIQRFLGEESVHNPTFRRPQTRTDRLHTLFARPLEHRCNSGIDAWRTGSNRRRQPPTCNVRLRHGDKLCVERDTPLPRPRPACTTTVVCTVCACSQRRYVFKRRDPWRATSLLTQGPQFSR